MARDERKWLKGKVDSHLRERQRARRDLWYFKVHGGPHQRAGVPDYIGCLAGRFWAVELKHPDDADPQPGPRQLVELQAIRSAQGRTLVTNNLADVIAFLDSIAG